MRSAKLVFVRLGHLGLMVLAYLLAAALAGQVFAWFVAEKTAVSDYALAGLLDTLLVFGFYFVASHKLSPWLNSSEGASEKAPVEDRAAIAKSPPQLVFNGGDILKSAATALLILGIPTALLFALGYYSIAQVQTWQLLPLACIALFVQGLSAEVLFRGILFQHLLLWMGPFKATVLLSCVYAGLNMLLDGVHLQVFLTQGLFCSYLCLLYLRTRSLWVTGTFHGIWLCVSFFPGVLDEHWREAAPWVTEVQGSIWLSGGGWGAEASLLTLLILMAASMDCYRKILRPSSA